MNLNSLKIFYLNNKIFRLVIIIVLYFLIVRPVYNLGKADGRRINSDTPKEVIK